MDHTVHVNLSGLQTVDFVFIPLADLDTGLADMGLESTVPNEVEGEGMLEQSEEGGTTAGMYICGIKLWKANY